MPKKKSTATRTKNRSSKTAGNVTVPESLPSEKAGTAQQKEWLNPTEAMKYLGISAATLYKLMDNGLLPFYTIRGIRKRRIKREDLDELMEKGRPSSQGG